VAPLRPGERAVLRRSLGLSENDFLVLLAGGGEGSGGIARRAAAILRWFADVDVIAVCGHATVRLGYRETTLEIEVCDDGSPRPRGAAPPGTGGGPVNGSGNGIAGMTERAAALGGTLAAGPRPEGGFEVRARLPLRGSPAHAGCAADGHPHAAARRHRGDQAHRRRRGPERGPRRDPDHL
jgi:hypothetical protein